ncbi:MAG TPA: hypothetical protein VFN67_18970 [Polyangiales bacterium]|nr:hypothetical protein [Polyangiales bacterium]
MVGPLISARPSGAPALVRRKSLIGFRAASEQTWGEAGIAAISRALPEAVRERTVGLRPLPAWIPLDDLIAWHVAVWNGPAQQDEVVMTRHARLTVDQGFGRVKRVMIAALSPHGLAARVGPLWREEYSTGRLETLALDEHSVQLLLTQHKYVEIPLMRLIIVEAYRHVLGMTRARDVTASYALVDGALRVILRWR